MPDQFYTKKSIALDCYNTIKDREYEIWLEPSAGTGNFYNLLPKEYRYGIDIEPKHDDVVEMDFFDLDFEPDNIITIGNPPFGYRAQGAIAFFNHAATFSNTIAFIVPRSFRKAYIINQLNPYFHITKEIILDLGAFEGGASKVRTVWQVWDRKEEKRAKIVLPKTHPDFSIIGQGQNFSAEDADFAIRRTGYKTVGEIKDVSDATPITQYVFIKGSKEVRERFGRLDLSCAFDTALAPTVTQGEIIRAYEDSKQMGT